MPDAQTIYEIRLACCKPGCPVCALVQRAGAQYIEGIFSESMLDPGVRRNLVKSLGFCYTHTWESINLKLSDALGHAILFQDLVNDAMETLVENGKNSGSQLASALNSLAACPACKIEEATAERIIDSMAVAFQDGSFIFEFNQSAGLCIPHLRRLLPNLNGKSKVAVLSHQYTCMESLKEELAEFIRKSDYRFREEAIGKEGDSYKRAAEMMKGKNLPSEKKDWTSLHKR